MKKRIAIPVVLLSLTPLTMSAAVARKAVPRKTTARKTVQSPAARKRRLTPPPVDPTDGDNVDGDDLVIRRAAVAALGPVAGSVAVVDPSNGRILTIVNQKLALKSGFTPCSTIKLVTSVAALTEHVVEPDDWVYIGRYSRFNLTTALAKSNNQYFATLGNRLGFERVIRYAQMLGLGEKAALNLPDEQPGTVVDEPPKIGGVGLMTSFGEGFSVTPLELAGLVSAIANGGILYYLQYPRSQEEIDRFTPIVKRSLQLTVNGIPDIRAGMRAAVDFGTAKRAADVPGDPVFGKTGTCTDFRASSHMGWFASFNDVGQHQLVVVVMLTGGHDVNGPVAAGVAGAIYRALSEQSYFAANTAGQDFAGVTGAR